ncbi:MAG TPA: acyltransferase [Ktedonobacterales bacterium]
MASGTVEASTSTGSGASVYRSPQRLGYVDSLRALAALYVVVCHCALEIWPTTNFPNGFLGIMLTYLSFGHLAVSVFIVLSGFSLMLPVARNGYHLPWGIWGFYVRRAHRILPPYYLAMGLSLLLIWLFIGHKTGTHWDVSLPVTGRSIIQHLLLVQDLSPTDYATINHVFWSIAMECQIYLLFPLLILLWWRYPPLFSGLITIGVSLALVIGLTYTWVGRLPGYTGYSFVPQYIGLFGMGMFAASIYTKQTPRWTRWRDRYLWEGVTIVGAAAVLWRFTSGQVLIPDLLVGVTTVGVLLAAARPGRINPIRATLEWRPLVWVGGIAYSIYLIHAPLIQLLWQYGLRPLGLSAVHTYLALLLVGVPLIVAASWLFWWWGERPFLNPPSTSIARMSNKN